MSSLLKDFDTTITAESGAEAEFIDIDLSFKANRLTGDVFLKKGYRAVAQSLKTIVLTNPGDLPYDEEFGVGVNSILGENYSVPATLALKDRIYSQVEKYEPRVELSDVVVDFNNHALTIRIAYFVKNNPVEQSVVIEVERVL